MAQGQVAISGTSLNPDGGNQNDFAAVTACNRAPQVGVLYRNSETEPHLAVNRISTARTPEAIMQMPAGLWRSLELASVLMGVDADLSQPPCFDAAG